MLEPQQIISLSWFINENLQNKPKNEQISSESIQAIKEADLNTQSNLMNIDF